MKLKFRADKDDLIIFGVFALFLLYIIAIGIVNLHTLTTEGVFSGFKDDTFNLYSFFNRNVC